MATENRHIEQIYDTRSNLQSNLDNGQIAIETDGTEQLVYKDDDGTYHIVANTAEAASFTNLTATGSLTIAETMYHSGDSDTYFSFADDQQTWVVGGVTMMDFTETTQDIISFNPGNVDVDFRVGATGAANALFVRGSDGRIGFNESAPDTSLHVTSAYVSNRGQFCIEGTSAYAYLTMYNGATYSGTLGIVNDEMIVGNYNAGSGGVIKLQSKASGATTITCAVNGDVTFSDNIYVADDKAIGISGGARLVFDASATPDTITITSADVIIGDDNYFGLGPDKGRLVFNNETTDTLTLKTADFIVENTAASTITIQGSGTEDSVVALVIKNTTGTVASEVGIIEFNAQDSTPGHYINFASISAHGLGSTGTGKMYLRTTLDGVETAVIQIVDGHVGIRGTPDTVTVLSLYGEAAFIRVASGGAYAIGLAYKYKNNSGSEIAANRIVKFSTANNASILLADQAGAMPIGITAAAIANGGTGWVVVSGEAWVKFVSGDTPTRGDVAIVSTTDGEAEGLATIPAATHWAEIGHVPTTGTDGGVAKVQLHYN